MGFWSLHTVWRTVQGYEAMYQLRKGRVRGTSSRGHCQAGAVRSYSFWIGCLDWSMERCLAAEGIAIRLWTSSKPALKVVTEGC